jgi:uncharacterized protein
MVNRLVLDDRLAATSADIVRKLDDDRLRRGSGGAMLIEFRVENHRSLRDEQALSLEAGSLGDDADPRPREVPGHATRLLTVAALYGANASGKSNVLAAIAFMREAVMRSHRAWPPEGGVPRDPFAWGPKQAEPSLFEVTFLLGGVRHEYGFVADDQRFLEEWLYAWPKGRKQTWLEREGDSFKFGDHLAGENRVVQEVTRPNALFLSTAVQHRHAQLSPIYRWFRALQAVGIEGETASYVLRGMADVWLARALEHPGRQPSLFDDQFADELAEFRELIRAADVGIVDFKLGDTERHGRPRLMVQHRSEHADAWLPLEQESRGTLTLFRIAPVLVEVLRTGGVLVVDELEASLHPLLALNIVRRFNDAATNPRNAQLLFTTHDTHLLGTVLGEPALRRDQIWLTEKDDEGATALYPLTDYKPRKSENLERGYLQGRYGAIPFLGDLVPVDADRGE